MRRPHLPANGIAGLQVKFADLRGRNVDVIRPGQIVVVRGAKKTIAVGKDFEDTFGENVAFFFTLRLQNIEDQVLLAHAAGAGKVERPSNFGQLGYVLFFEFSNGHWSPAKDRK